MARTSRAYLDTGSLLPSSGVWLARSGLARCGLAGWLAGCWLASSSFACGGMLAEPAPQVETAALHDGAGDPVIATLHTRDSELKITASGGRVRYALLDEHGVSKSLTLDEIQRHDPNLYEFVKAALASHGAPVLDARIEKRPGLLPVPTQHIHADRHRAVLPDR